MRRKLAEVVTELLPHQQRVVSRMLDPNQPGLVVAHGLGSGKTLTSIATQDALGMPASVVLPAALQENYAKERAKHLTGDTQPADMTTLQAIARRGEPPSGRLLIVDEAHRIRDASSKGSQALRRSAAEKRMLLTATPFYNAASDVAPLINVAAGKNVLPNDPNEFYGRYVTDQVVMPSWWGRNIRHETPGIVEKVNPKTAPALRATFAKYMDYHPSSQEGFPSVERKDVKVEMSPEQLKIYDAMLGEAPPWVAAKIRAGLPPSKREAQELNAFMGAVRQVSNTTGAYAPDADVHQPKIEQAFQNLQQYLGENERAKAVVYSNYLESGLHPYAQKLQEAGIPHGMFTGEMKQHERDQMVRDYNEGKLKALLLSSAGGEGLDLKGTRLMQVLDPHWNEEKLRQVEGRGVRYGSHADLPEEERKVLIERYLATRPRSGVMEKLHLKKPGGSVDEYLTNLSGEKERLHEQFRQLMPGYEKTSSVEKRALIERLVRLGATDIPSTPRLFMRHRSPEELATLQHAVEHAYDARVTNPLMGVIQKATGKLPAGKLRTVVDKGARLVAEDPVGTLAANLVPVPGAHPAYVAGKKLLEKGIDTAFPVPTLTPKLAELAELAEDGKHELQGRLKFQGIPVAVENRKTASGQRCLSNVLRIVEKDPSLTVMAGPPDRGQDTRHFWAVDQEGKVHDPTFNDYSRYNEGKPLDMKSNAKFLDGLRKKLSLSGQPKLAAQAGYDDLPGVARPHPDAYNQPALRLQEGVLPGVSFKTAAVAVRAPIQLEGDLPAKMGQVDVVPTDGVVVNEVNSGIPKDLLKHALDSRRGFGALPGLGHVLVPSVGTLSKRAHLEPSDSEPLLHGRYGASQLGRDFGRAKTGAVESPHLFGADGKPSHVSEVASTFGRVKLSELAEDGVHQLQGHRKFQGLSIAVENRAGSTRSGTTPDGHHWKTKMRADYGYIEVPAKGKDGEGIDVYVGPDKKAPDAFVVHQHKPDGTGHDEDKVMLGFRSLEEAKAMYLKHYDDPKFLGPISTVPVEELKKKLQTDDRIEKISAAYLLKQSMEFFDSPDKAREALQPGDVLVTTKPGENTLKGRVVAKILEMAQRAPTYHAAIYAGDGKVIQAKGPGGTHAVVETPLEEFHDHYKYKALRVNASPEEKQDAVRFAESAVGKKYDTLGLAKTLIPGGSTKKWRVSQRNQDAFFCSSLVAAAYPSKAFMGRTVNNTRPVDLLKSKSTSLVGKTASAEDVSVGYASATVQPRGEDGVTVEKLWVDPEHRGKGEARKLMESIKDQFADKDIWLKPRPFGDMEAPLEVLKEFYKTMGFEVMDKQDNMRLPRRKEQSRG